ncbi:unnamed protein product [Ilex paraguariensis]|uniref:Uncharacterized protein n=1 Tax=Ilex paraguariensis TaxID=185542 RepID=A0ABC8STV4_9AQUA
MEGTPLQVTFFFIHLPKVNTFRARLTLMNFDGLSHLNICAPNLLFFYIGGVFEDVSLENTFHLAIVSIGLYVNAGYEQNEILGNTSNMIKFFAHMPCIQKLVRREYRFYIVDTIVLCIPFVYNILAASKVPGRLPTPCIELNYLSICINFNDVEENLAALCLLRSCPHIQELEMLARPEEQTCVQAVANILEEDYFSCAFNQLHLLK